MAGAALAWAVLPRTERRRAENGSGRFDLAGATTFAGAVTFALLALTFGSAWGWSSPTLIACTVLGLAGLLTFLAAERRVRFPLIALELFRQRTFTAGILSGLLSYTVLFGALFVAPFYLQRTFGYGPSQTGFLLTAIPVAIGLLAPFSGALTDHLGSRPPTVAGMLVAALGLTVLWLDQSGPLTTVLIALGLLGVGLGFFTPPNNSAIMGSAPASHLGVAGGVLNMTRGLGTSLGVAATGAVLALALSSATGTATSTTVSAPSTALSDAFRWCWLFLAAVAVAAGAISTLRDPGPVAIDPEARGDLAGL